MRETIVYTTDLTSHNIARTLARKNLKKSTFLFLHSGKWDWFTSLETFIKFCQTNENYCYDLIFISLLISHKFLSRLEVFVTKNECKKKISKNKKFMIIILMSNSTYNNIWWSLPKPNQHHTTLTKKRISKDPQATQTNWKINGSLQKIFDNFYDILFLFCCYTLSCRWRN